MPINSYEDYELNVHIMFLIFDDIMQRTVLDTVSGDASRFNANTPLERVQAALALIIDPLSSGAHVSYEISDAYANNNGTGTHTFVIDYLFDPKSVTLNGFMSGQVSLESVSLDPEGATRWTVDLATFEGKLFGKDWKEVGIAWFLKTLMSGVIFDQTASTASGKLFTAWSMSLCDTTKLNDVLDTFNSAVMD
jgi:hypothetical protein